MSRAAETPSKDPPISSEATPLRLGGVARAPKDALGAGRTPDFFIVGASKSGTTSLWMYLRRHPKLYFVEPKEPEFFSKDDRRALGLAWYRSLFAAAADDQLCGEASTTYARYPHFGDVPARLAEVAPEARLLYIMREPVSRTYAQYRHRMRLNVKRGTFEEWLAWDDQFIDTSCYMMQIEQFLRCFRPDQLHCLLTEDLRNNPGPTLDAVQGFLGIERADLSERGAIAVNRAEEASDDYARQRLGKTVRSIPGLRPLLRALPSGFKDGTLRFLTASRLGGRLKSGYQPSPLTPETAAMLRERFREPNARLGEFLGRDLSHWDTPPEARA